MKICLALKSAGTQAANGCGAGMANDLAGQVWARRDRRLSQES